MFMYTLFYLFFLGRSSARLNRKRSTSQNYVNNDYMGGKGEFYGIINMKLNFEFNDFNFNAYHSHIKPSSIVVGAAATSQKHDQHTTRKLMFYIPSVSGHSTATCLNTFEPLHHTDINNKRGICDFIIDINVPIVELYVSGNSSLQPIPTEKKFYTPNIPVNETSSSRTSTVQQSSEENSKKIKSSTPSLPSLTRGQFHLSENKYSDLYFYYYINSYFL